MIVSLATEGDSYLYMGFILFAVAVVLLFVELFVPSGGLLGMLCGIAAIGSVFAFFRYDQTWGVVASALYLILGPIALLFIFKLWLHSPLAKRMILGAETDAAGAGDDGEALALAERTRRERLAQLQELIGAEGRTETGLRPVGVVKINGQRVDALAEGGVIEADTPVIVVDVYDNQIKVRPK